MFWKCREDVGGIMSLLLDRRRQGEMKETKMVELVFLGKLDVKRRVSFVE